MKEMVVKQTVEVNPADEHPGVSEGFFFLTVLSKQKQAIFQALWLYFMKDTVYL